MVTLQRLSFIFTELIFSDQKRINTHEIQVDCCGHHN
jgi:hypothetical protein